MFFYRELWLVYGGWVERSGAEGSGHGEGRDSIPLLRVSVEIPGAGLALDPKFEDR